jgi:CRISPR system Cascade subunit CasA
MNESFNLLDEPWLPVRYLNGNTRDVGLIRLFADARQIATLADTAPPNLIAHHRLLLAILHRALTRHSDNWKNRDRALWFEQGLPEKAVIDYLEHWRERFWLFHPENPFMQAAVLNDLSATREKQKPWTQISLASASGNAPAVFDHACDSTPTATTASTAIRMLLGFLQFTPGGLVKIIRSSDKAGPLANTAAVVPLGDSLEQTLCLALHPAQVQQEDLPTWERPAPKEQHLAEEPLPASGPNDRYTRLTRAVLLLPEEDGSIQWLRFAAGCALLESEDATDPMSSYRAGSNDKMIRVSFREGRAFWRDLPALLPDDTAREALPAAVLGYASNLHKAISLRPPEQPLLVAGLASDQAKLLRWRTEQHVLPTNLLEDPALTRQLRRLIIESENLFKIIRSSASRAIANTLPEPDSKDTQARARQLFDNGPATGTYFAEAERAFPTALNLLGDKRPADADALWHSRLKQAAQNSWSAMYDSLGRSPQALRAEAIVYPKFRAQINAWARSDRTQQGHTS